MASTRPKCPSQLLGNAGGSSWGGGNLREGLSWGTSVESPDHQISSPRGNIHLSTSRGSATNHCRSRSS